MQIRPTSIASAVALCTAVLILTSTVEAGPFSYQVIDANTGPVAHTASAVVQQPGHDGSRRIGNRHGMDDPANHDANDDRGHHRRHRHRGPG